MNRPCPVGFHGKIRWHGDFVGRGLPAGFVKAWDAWLQYGLLAAREQLGRDWLDDYLCMPLWCFALHRGVIDDAAYAGVLLPSIDAVGRYYPLTIARPMRADALRGWVERSGPWYRDAAALALSTLKPRFAAGAFEAGLGALCEPRIAPYASLNANDSPAGAAGMNLLGAGVFWTQAGDAAPAPHYIANKLDATLFLQLLAPPSGGRQA